MAEDGNARTASRKFDQDFRQDSSKIPQREHDVVGGDVAAGQPAGESGAVHPDDFLLDQLDLSPPTMLQLIDEQAARTRKPPLTPRDLATLLGRAGVPGFADEILRLMSTPIDGTRSYPGRGE